MFSMAAASAVLPMLPSQILLNNLLYDTSQLTIPTDRVDPEQLHAPSHWDIGMIRRFMLFFGPISSLFDFLTFALMLGVFHAGPELFRGGWFAESLATQTLVILAIRTRANGWAWPEPCVGLPPPASRPAVKERLRDERWRGRNDGEKPGADAAHPRRRRREGVIGWRRRTLRRARR